MAPRFHCRFFDLNLDSELALPELQCVGPDRGLDTISIGLARGPFAAEAVLRWRQNVDHPGEPGGPQSALVGAHTLLRFSGLADFLIEREPCRVRCLPAQSLPPSTLRHLLLDQVLPRLVGQRGRLVLHASAVALPAGVIAFVGRSGWGKSTLAAGFDWPAIPFVDDSLLLLPGVGGGTRAVASYPGLRLWPDAIAALFADSAMGEEFTGYSKKRRVAVPREKTPVPRTPLPDSLPLLALFLLNDPVAEPVPEIVIEPAAGAATLMELLRRCFLLDPGDPVAARRLWQASGDLLRAGVPVARLGYPRLHSYRPHLCERLLEYVDRRAASIDTGTVTD